MKLQQRPDSRGVALGKCPAGLRGPDAMLAGKGSFRDTSILVPGVASTGETSAAAVGGDDLCRKSKKCLASSVDAGHPETRP
jgi:circadian clock protein KaiC